MRHIWKLRHRKRSRAQGLVEFALVLPVLLLVLLICIDAGRLFYAHVAIHNATRIASNYAATHADAWPGPAPVEQAEFSAQIARDTTGLDCDPGTVPSPVFAPAGPPPRSPGDGHTATVTLLCVFHPLTPIISAIIGDSVQLSASDTFPIRSGLLAGIPLIAGLPTATPVAPTPTPTLPPVPTPTPVGTPAPTPRPGECVVPRIIGRTTDQATSDWVNAGFKAAKLNVSFGLPNYVILREWIGQTISTWDGTFQNCNAFSLNVGPTP